MITTILEIDYNEKKNFVKKISKKVKMPKMVLKFATEQNINFGHIVRRLGPPPPAALVAYPQSSTFWNRMFSLWNEAQFLGKIQEKK